VPERVPVTRQSAPIVSAGEAFKRKDLISA
jgi:hypothetical protein